MFIVVMSKHHLIRLTEWRYMVTNVNFKIIIWPRFGIFIINLADQFFQQHMSQLFPVNSVRATFWVVETSPVKS